MGPPFLKSDVEEIWSVTRISGNAYRAVVLVLVVVAEVVVVVEVVVI